MDMTLLRPKELAAELRLSRASAYRLAQEPGFPSAFRLSKGIRGWRRGEVHAWLENRREGPAPTASTTTTPTPNKGVRNAK